MGWRSDVNRAEIEAGGNPAQRAQPVALALEGEVLIRRDQPDHVSEAQFTRNRFPGSR